AIHQLIQVDEAARGLIHGALDFGKGLRAGKDGERAAGIDDGPHADGAVHVGAEFQRGGHGLAYAATQGLRRGEQTALPEQIAAAVSSPGLFEFFPERLRHSFSLSRMKAARGPARQAKACPTKEWAAQSFRSRTSRRFQYSAHPRNFGSARRAKR